MKSIRIDQWSISDGMWKLFRECDTMPEAKMFVRHYRATHPQIKWRIVPNDQS